MTNSEIQSKVKQIIKLFVHNDYETIATFDSAKLSPEVLKQVIDDYGVEFGGVMTMPPDTAFQVIDVYALEEDEPHNWRGTISVYTIQNEDSTTDHAFDYDFWFDNEQSDLTLKATIFSNGNWELTDIRVL